MQYSTRSTPFPRRSLEILLAYHYQSYILEIIYTHLTLEEKINALVRQTILSGCPKATLMCYLLSNIYFYISGIFVKWFFYGDVSGNLFESLKNKVLNSHWFYWSVIFVIIRLQGKEEVAIQKQPLELLCKKDVFVNFTNLTRKHLRWSLFLMKLQAWKKDTNTVVFMWNLRSFSENLFWRTSANDCFWLLSDSLPASNVVE